MTETPPTFAEVADTMRRHLGAEAYAYSTADGWVVLPLGQGVDAQTHSMMFHASEVTNEQQHDAHHAAGIDPARYVPHVHREAHRG